MRDAPPEAGHDRFQRAGYYKSGAFGIRIENLVLVTPPEPVPGGERPMMGFETLTLAPIDRELVDVKLLTVEERKWLNEYHARVAAVIGPQLDGAAESVGDRGDETDLALAPGIRCGAMARKAAEHLTFALRARG